MLIVDKSSPLPLYYQLKEWLINKIDSGFYPVDSQLPSETFLSEKLGISRGTVRRAIDELVNEGGLYRVQGRGTFVRQPKLDYGLAPAFTSLVEDMMDKDVPFTSEVLDSKLMPAGEDIAEKLGIEPGDNVYFLERLGRLRGEPCVLATTYLPAALCPGLLEQDLTNRPLYGVLERKYGLKLWRAKRTVGPSLAGEYEAMILETWEGAPIQILETISYLEGGRPVEYSKLRFRGDRTKFTILVRRAAARSPDDCPVAEDKMSRLFGARHVS